MLKNSVVDHSWDRRSKEKSEEKTSFDLGLIEEIKKNIFSDLEKNKELMLSRPNWNEYFMILAKIAATRSTCLSRPTGAIIVKDKQVIATGYNGSMPNAMHCSDDGACFRRKVGANDLHKYDNCRSVHAEANAIAQASKKGISVDGAEIYTTLHPCYVCTKLMVSSGIKKVHYEFEYKFSDGSQDKLWEEALAEAGIEAEQVNLSNVALLKTLQSLLSATSWRKELLPTGEPTGRIENINKKELF